MKLHRTLVLPALALCASFVLGGCTFLEPTPLETPSPTPTVVDTTKFIGGVVDPSDTVWSGRDSGGDDTTLTLRSDGTVAVTYGDSGYDYPGDTWHVRAEVLYVEVYLNEVHGTAYYVGSWNPETVAIDAVLRTSKTAKQLTLTLTQE